MILSSLSCIGCNVGSPIALNNYKRMLDVLG